MPTPHGHRTGPFTVEELDEALASALARLADEGEEAIERAEDEGLVVVLRGGEFRVRIAALRALLASRLEPA